MLNPMDMSGRRVMVTGASAGIGRETSILLSQLGASVVLVGRDPSRLDETKALLQGSGHRLERYDLTGSADIPGWIKRIAEEFGSLSGLVHCAGLQMTLPLRGIQSLHIARITEINLTAAIMLTKGLSQRGVHAAESSIVFMSSVMGLVGSPGRSLYSATKGALVGMTRSLAIELAKEGLRVNCVAPAFVDTAMLQEMKDMVGTEGMAAIEAAHPLGIGRPRDVANAVAFLLADTARWVTGTTLVVDGGYTAR